MRDLSLLIMLLTLAFMAWRQAWVGVLGLTLLGTMHPQAYANEWMANFPIYKVLFLVTVLSAGVEAWKRRSLPTLAWDWRLPVLGLLFLDFVVTTHHALLPDTSRQVLLQVGGLLPPLLLTLVLIDSREKFQALIATFAAAIALVALKGGYWALMTGFQDRVYGPPGSQIGGNNEFAVALAMTIPLLVFWRRQMSDRALGATLAGAIGLCYVAALTSWSRGGLLALAVMSALLVWHSRRKTLALLLAAAGVVLVLGIMPAHWQARMESIGNYQADQSFLGRQEAWKTGLAYVEKHPWTGAGFDGWRYLSAAPKGENSLSQRSWHSAYIQILTEHGVPGFVLWTLLLAGTLIDLTRLVAHGRRSKDSWLSDCGATLRTAFVAYLVGAVALGIATWELMFQLMAYAMVARGLARTPANGVGYLYSQATPAPEEMPRPMKTHDNPRLAR